MKPATDPEVAEWLGYARDDRHAVELMRPHGLHDLVCFHSQQAAEKDLKALLVATGLVPPRTHHLAPLLADLGSAGVDCTAIQADALRLSPFAVIARYPGFGHTDDATAAGAAQAMQRVHAFVEQMFAERAGLSAP